MFSIRINFIPSGQQTTCPTSNNVVLISNSPKFIVQPQGSVNSSQGLYVESKQSCPPTLNIESLNISGFVVIVVPVTSGFSGITVKSSQSSCGLKLLPPKNGIQSAVPNKDQLASTSGVVV